MTSPLRLALFIDAQNTYKGARESFFHRDDPSPYGQIDPMELGRLIESRGGPGGQACVLTDVRVYTGRPDSTKAPKTYSAHMKQCAQWQADGVTLIWRALRYPWDWPDTKAEEKGIDVALAIDYVAMAVDALYDVGVIMSTDTDVIPALEFTHTRFPGERSAAVAAWRSQNSNRRLIIPGANTWCHWLHRADYDAVADLTDYTR